MKIVIGLGNPGRKYKNTRHNAGFMAVDAFCKEKNLIFEKKNRLHAELAVVRRAGCRHFLVKPLTYMNLSGKAAAKILDYYKLQPENTLVICDDFQLPLGSLRIREKGSSGGHNGLDSIIQETGLTAFNRLRIGIGTEGFHSLKSMNEDFVTQFVLSDFSGQEKAVIKDVLKKVIDSLELFFQDNLKKAMNLYNTKIKNSG